MSARSFSCPHSSNGSANNNDDGCDASVAVAAPPGLMMRHRHRVGVVGSIEDPSYVVASSSSSEASLSTFIANDRAGSESSSSSASLSVPVAVLLWYLLGVISIASSKVLLTRYTTPPLVLTMQQLIVGMTLLRIMMEMQTTTSSSSGGGVKEKGGTRGGGMRPVPIQRKDRYCSSGSNNTNINNTAAATSVEKCEAGTLKRKAGNGGDMSSSSASSSEETTTLITSLLGWVQSSRSHRIHNQLLLAAIYFALGFLLTNYGFMLGSAAFVETIKAAEPFTSASVAVLWGIEQLGLQEVLSLTGIAMGVTLSTLGHGKDSTTQSSSLISHGIEMDDHETIMHRASSVPSLTTICFIVMASNLCFSFRGLHQKLFRATPQGHVLMVDDLNLQYRMQQIGALMLIIPTLLENSSLFLDKMQHLLLGSPATNNHAIRYILLSLTNGVAFTSYNLASTYVLTKISVVHHAALNCIRRVFAIVVTSIIFGLAITSLQVVGIGMAVAGFFSYIHFKMRKVTKDSRRKELRRKWGRFLVGEKTGKWKDKQRSSLLPLNSTAK